MPRRFTLLRLFIHARRLLRNDQVLLALLAVVLGGLAGLAAIGFRLTISGAQYLAWGFGGDHLASGIAGAPGWCIVLVPAMGGLAIGVATRWILPNGRPQGVANVIEEAARRGGRLSLGTGLGAALLSASSIGLGASVGREGPVVHLGATLGSWLGQRLRVPSGLMRTMLGCGVASGVAASFNAPIAGVFFALEVVVGQYSLSAFAPIVLASVVGTAISRLYFGNFPAFSLPGYAIESVWEFPAFVLLGIVAAGVAVVLMRSVFAVEDAFTRHLRRLPRWVWPGMGGLATGLIALWFPHVLGVGYEGTDLALRGELELGLLLGLLVAKVAATALSLGSGFSGGIFSPALFVGAAAGGAFGLMAAMPFPDLASEPGVYSIAGMGAVAGAVLGAPISTILIIFELTGDYAVTTAVMIGTVTAAAVTNGLVGHSFFTWQLRRRGVAVAGTRDLGPVANARVGDIMRSEVPTVAADAGGIALLDALRKAPFGELVVTDSMGRLVGLLAVPDVAPLLSANAPALLAGDLARRNLPLVTATDDLREALAALGQAGLARLPVVDGRESRRVIGLAHERDVLFAWNRAVTQASS